MTSSIPTVEAIKEGFPYLTIPKQTGEPNYESIHAVHKLIKANAASIPSEFGGGRHGLLCLVLSPTVYQHVTGHAFVRPVNPGTTPTIPPRATGEATRRLEREHKERLQTFREMSRTDQALQQQVLSAFDDMYLKGMRQPHIGYTNRTTLELLTHLYDNYGLILQMDLSDNEKRMKTPYDVTTPIENLFAQMDDAIEFATAGHAAFTDAQILTTAFLLVYQTGELDKGCTEWEEKPAAEKTYANFKTHFTTAHQRFRNLQRLKQTGFGHSNQMNNIQMIENQQETASALQALATATSSDRTAVANLTKANQELTTHLTTMTDTVSNLENKIISLESKIDTLLLRSKSAYDRNSEAYCHSHGRTFNPNHTSKTCVQRKNGHKQNATLHNRMGGSSKNCGDPSE